MGQAKSQFSEEELSDYEVILSKPIQHNFLIKFVLFTGLDLFYQKGDLTVSI